MALDSMTLFTRSIPVSVASLARCNHITCKCPNVGRCNHISMFTMNMLMWRSFTVLAKLSLFLNAAVSDQGHQKVF